MAAGIKLTEEEVKRRLGDAGAELIGPYKNANSKVLVRCAVHRTESEVIANTLFCGAKLRCCASLGGMLSQEEVALRIAKKGYELRSKYLGTESNIVVYCKKHDQEHVVRARGVVSSGDNLSCCGREAISKKMTGRDVTDEFRRKCSDVQKGDRAYWSGKVFAKEHREKISKGGERHFASSVDSHIAHAKRGATAGKPGWFYIFRVGDMLKFGSVSRMTPEKRMEKIRRDTGLPCSIEMTAQVDDAGSYEAAMMDKFRDHWVRHEYFSQSLLQSL